MLSDTDFQHFPIEPGDDDEEGVEEPTAAGFKDPRDGRVWRNWWTPFLETLALTGNVSQAARVAGISPQWANHERRQHEHFSLCWYDATLQAADLLRQVARRVSVEGEEVTTVREEFDGDGRLVARVVTTKTVRDNALLARLLTAHCPEFREQRDFRFGGIPGSEPVKVEVSPVRTPERLAALIDAMRESGLIPESLPPAEPEDSD